MHFGRLLAPVDQFESVVRQFIDSGGRGLSVTAPFKLEAFELANVRSDLAAAAGAANTLRISALGIEAENFDGAGLVRDIQINHAYSLLDKRILILGAGGATRGVVLPILRCRPRSLTIANRDPYKAQALVRLMQPYVLHNNNSCELLTAGLGELAPYRYDVIINATSASLLNTALNWNDQAMKGVQLFYDMNYGSWSRHFKTVAEGYQIPQIANGVGMLVEQAALAFAWWRGVEPATPQVISDLSAQLGE